MSDQPQGELEMPRYRCHKEVRALKIAHIGEGEGDDSSWLYPADVGYRAIEVSPEYMAKHKPKAGGYYVVYNDGYKSFSPAEAFEEGYKPI